MRSRAALDYASVQTALDTSRADEPLQLLQQIGTLRRALEAARGGVSLDLPSQEVTATPGGGFELQYAAPLPVESWNAQISLLTGMEAARIMIDAHVGIVRTVPPPQQWTVDWHIAVCPPGVDFLPVVQITRQSGRVTPQ